MHPKTSLTSVAMLATLALAAPTTSPSLPQGTLTIPVQGSQQLPFAKALTQAYRKFGTDLGLLNPLNILGSLGSLGALGSLDPFSGGTPSSPPTGISPSSQVATPAPTASALSTSSSNVAAPTPSASSTPTTGINGEVAADPEAHDEAYLSPITIGGQTLTLDLDTGSSDLWVFSSELPPSELGSHTAFNPSKSSTWRSYAGATWNITYGDQSTASGNVGFDTVSVGGAVVKGQAVELAQEVSGEFVTDKQSDGLMGLGFSNINTVKPQQQKTFFENIMTQLSQPVFTVDLDTTAGGSYDFGVIDASKYTGDIHYTPVDTSLGYWMFNSTSYTIGGQAGSCTDCIAIADTGTSLMLLNNNTAAAYYAKVPGAQYLAESGVFAYPCSSTLPDLGVAVGDYTAVIPGSALLYEQSNSACLAGVQPNVNNDFLQVYGDVFLKQFFAVFDGGNVRFGVAQKA